MRRLAVALPKVLRQNPVHHLFDVQGCAGVGQEPWRRRPDRSSFSLWAPSVPWAPWPSCLLAGASGATGAPLVGVLPVGGMIRASGVAFAACGGIWAFLWAWRA